MKNHPYTIPYNNEETMHMYKADAAIVKEEDFEELEPGLVYIDRKGGFVAIADPASPADVLLVELDQPRAE
jgi:hypothetical protein